MEGLLIFGDSITYGKSRAKGMGWADRIKADFDALGFHHAAYNLGVAGDTSADLVKRFPVELAARAKFYRPTNTFTVLIAIGINDSRLIGGKPQTRPGTFRRRLRALVRIARAKNTKPVLAGLTPVAPEAADYEGTSFTMERIHAYDAIIRAVAAETRTPYIGLLAAMPPKATYFDDGVHLSKRGNDIVYHAVRTALEKLGVL